MAAAGDEHGKGGPQGPGRWHSCCHGSVLVNSHDPAADHCAGPTWASDTQRSASDRAAVAGRRPACQVNGSLRLLMGASCCAGPRAAAAAADRWQRIQSNNSLAGWPLFAMETIGQTRNRLAQSGSLGARQTSFERGHKAQVAPATRSAGDGARRRKHSGRLTLGRKMGSRLAGIAAVFVAQAERRRLSGDIEARRLAALTKRPGLRRLLSAPDDSAWHRRSLEERRRLRAQP